LNLLVFPGETGRTPRDEPIGLRLPEKGLLLKGRLNPGRRIATSCLGSPKPMCRTIASLRPYPLITALFRQSVLNVARGSPGFALRLWQSRGNGRKSVARQEADGPTHRFQEATRTCQTALAPFGSGFCGHSTEVAKGYSRRPMQDYSGQSSGLDSRKVRITAVLCFCRLVLAGLCQTLADAQAAVTFIDPAVRGQPGCRSRSRCDRRLRNDRTVRATR
jgi:hypothetical protein